MGGWPRSRLPLTLRSWVSEALVSIRWGQLTLFFEEKAGDTGDMGTRFGTTGEWRQREANRGWDAGMPGCSRQDEEDVQMEARADGCRRKG